MTISDFLGRLAQKQLTHTNYALAILWWRYEHEKNKELPSGEIAKLIRDSHLGNPNATNLASSLKKTKDVLSSDSGLCLKATSVHKFKEAYGDLVGLPPEQDHQKGFLSDDVWKKTRGYLEIVCQQLNGCYLNSFYDAASVMARRIVETLIIECFESDKKEQLIKGADGNYLMLNGLISAACAADGLKLGRDSKRALAEIKGLGDRSAHNRRFNAKKSDMDCIKDIFRVCVEELINIAKLK